MRNMNAGLRFVLAMAAIGALVAETHAQPGEEIDASQTTTRTTVVRTSPIPPPPPKQEVIAVEPSPQYVWIPGNWEREPNKWVWVRWSLGKAALLAGALHPWLLAF